MKVDRKIAVVLATLIAEEGSGRDVIRRAAEKGEPLSEGTLYPLLRAMETEGYLTCRTSEPVAERGGRRRFLYRVSGEGRVALAKYREETAELLGWLPVPGMGGVRA